MNSTRKLLRQAFRARRSILTRSTAIRFIRRAAAVWNPARFRKRACGTRFWFPHRVLMGDEELTREIAAAIKGIVAK